MMKKYFMNKLLLTLLLTTLGFNSICASSEEDVDDQRLTISFINQSGAQATRRASSTVESPLLFDGTGVSNSICVETNGLTQDILVSVTSGFSVTPSIIKVGAEPTEVTITHNSTRVHTDGKLILRSGDVRKYVHLVGTGTALPVKDISGSAVYAGTGSDAGQTFDASSLTDGGYTVEVKARTDGEAASLMPYAVTSGGLGFKGYVRSTSMGLKNSEGVSVSDKGISNPANGGTFYNTDGLYHTYRYAVTKDRRIFVYRDGLPVDTFRVADLALQPGWSEQSGEVEQNLIKNGSFEGEWDFSARQNITKYIEGWDVYPYDQYNSYQEIAAEERSNEVDQDNHVLSVNRYKWEAGWADAEISQIVDVAPNEVYSFSALAKGGIYEKNSSKLGSIKIQDLQNSANKQTLTIGSNSYETYATDFETKANTKQIRIAFCLAKAAWGANVSDMRVDDVKLTGVRRIPTQQVGFESSGADVEYFAFDPTGAYAPAFAEVSVEDISSITSISSQTTTSTIRATTDHGILKLTGVEEHSHIAVYQANGTQIAIINDYSSQQSVGLPGRGIYLIAIFDSNGKKTLKIAY